MKIDFIFDKRPRGRRVWIFKAGPGNVLFHHGAYGEAKRRATRWANSIGARRVQVIAAAEGE